MSAKPTSCGVLLLNPQDELLLCHATGAAHWDIPKGLGERVPERCARGMTAVLTQKLSLAEVARHTPALPGV